MSAVLEKPSRTKVVAQVKAVLKGGTIGSVIDDMWALREKKRAAEAVVKKIEDEILAQEEIVFKRLDEEGLKKADGTKASISIGEATVASVTDWDALWAYAAKHKYFHLFQKRVSDPAWRELMEKSKGKGVPGTEPFTKRKLNLRSLSSTV
jgi:hypothetical protein